MELDPEPELNVKLGRPLKLTIHQKRAVVRRARRGYVSASQLRTMYALRVGPRLVQQMLSEVEDLKWRRMKKAPRCLFDHSETFASGQTPTRSFYSLKSAPKDGWFVIHMIVAYCRHWLITKVDF